MNHKNKHMKVSGPSRRSAEAFHALRRAPVVMDHRLEPRGGAVNDDRDLFNEYLEDSSEDQDS